MLLLQGIDHDNVCRKTAPWDKIEKKTTNIPYVTTEQRL